MGSQGLCLDSGAMRSPTLQQTEFLPCLVWKLLIADPCTSFWVEAAPSHHRILEGPGGKPAATRWARPCRDRSQPE